MKVVRVMRLLEIGGGEQARASVEYDVGVVALELWQDREPGERPYVIWLLPEDAEMLAKALLDGASLAGTDA
jgi:hypothetical protein